MSALARIWDLELGPGTRFPVPELVPSHPAHPLSPAVLGQGRCGVFPELPGTRFRESFLVPGLVPGGKTAGHSVVDTFSLELPGTRTHESTRVRETTHHAQITPQVTALRVFFFTNVVADRFLVPGSSREHPVPRLSVHPHPTVCHRCRALILAALDSPVAGIPVRLDPVPLTAEQELAARLAGRATYNLTGISR